MYIYTHILFDRVLNDLNTKMTICIFISKTCMIIVLKEFIVRKHTII